MNFQDFLPPGTTNYRYAGYQQCLEVMERESERCDQEEASLSSTYNPYFTMDINESSFLECFVNSGESLLTLSWESYDPFTESALLKMESPPHAIAAGAFNIIFSRWADKVDDRILCPTTASNVRGATRNKKPDIGWCPANLPSWRSRKWPTFVGEVAFSEPRSKLLADVKFWLGDPESLVNVAITISVLWGKILIEDWEMDVDNEPSCKQRIEIDRNPHLHRSPVNGSLEIQFSDVFLRQRRGDEVNFVLTASDMQRLARRVWEYQYPSGGSSAAR